MKKLYNVIGAALAVLFTCVPANAGLSLTKGNATVSQNFDSMGATGLDLPAGWKVDRNLTAPRTVNTWNSAATSVMYAGGVNLASNASNGTWNFGKTDDTDRSIGGLTTTVANGTRCINLMTSLTNDDTEAINRFSVSYDIEKYREGDNAAGFAVQMYTSTDGENWTAAGEEFYTKFNPDSQTLGAAEVPISVTPVTAKTLLADVAPGETIYLAWNISVASGTSPNKAPGLAIDNVSITATYAQAGEDQCNLYVEDLTKWEKLMVHSADGRLGVFPGMEPMGSKTVNGVTYKAFQLPAAPVTVQLNNGVYYSLPELLISQNGDHYYTVTTSGYEAITNPESYTGYVDPSHPAFTSSGIYLRGEVNSWGSPAECEFSDEGNGNYALYNKTLSGQFKVSDANWSGSCNYGSNGSNLYPDTPYETVAGTDNNISCGTNTYICKEIRLSIVDGECTITVITDNDGIGLTTLYAVGDFNNWNYMDESGALKYDTADGTFKGTVTMPKSASDAYAHWRVYQRLGMGGAWGLDTDATEPSTSGTLVKGKSGNVATKPGTYTISFNLTTGEYSLEQQASQTVDMTLRPAETLLVPEVPETIKVLSLNNSLIHYNDQAAVFNNIAAANGKDASWTKHTLLGKTLQTHWDEGEGLAEDGNPGAKMMVRSDAWSHIILQEQSGLPRTDPEKSLSNLKMWIEYIRENCPNPNAVIILPMNWGYSSDWDNFLSNNREFEANYRSFADELGVVICPVALAYSEIFSQEGIEGTSTLFQDDRHPTDKSTYLAAVMEFALIYGIDPATITGTVPNVTDEEAASMRGYASTVMNSFVNNVSHTDGKVRLGVSFIQDNGLEITPEEPVTYTVDNDGTIDENGVFTSDGTLGEYNVTAKCGDFTKTAKIKVVAPVTEVITYPAITINTDNLSASENFNAMGTELALPEAWRIGRNTIDARGLVSYSQGDVNTQYAGGVNLPSNAKNGTWNFGDGAERAIGGITTGVANGTRAVNVMTHLLNDGSKKLVNPQLSYDIAKFRKGSNPAGFAVELYYSFNGNTWTTAGSDFYTKLEPDAATGGYAEVPGEVVNVSGILPFDLEPGVDLFLLWNISAASGDACNNAMALGIDNFNLSAEIPPVPTAAHYVYVDDQTGWDAIGLYAWGDSELFGAWPGEAPVDQKEIDGTTYKVFLLDNENPGTWHFIFNNWNNGEQAPDYDVTGDKDYYLRVSKSSVVPLDQPSSVEGPANDNKLTISFRGNVATAQGATSMTVVNTAGIALADVAAESIDLSNLPNGIYLLIASNDASRTVAKILK